MTRRPIPAQPKRPGEVTPLDAATYPWFYCAGDGPGRPTRAPAVRNPDRSLTMTDVLTASEKRLLKAIAATGEAKVMVYSDGRRPWRLERGGPGWKAQTFLSLANRGYLLIEYGFAGRKDVALTNVGHEIGA